MRVYYVKEWHVMNVHPIIVVFLIALRPLILYTMRLSVMPQHTCPRGRCPDLVLSKWEPRSRLIDWTLGLLYCVWHIRVSMFIQRRALCDIVLLYDCLNELCSLSRYFLMLMLVYAGTLSWSIFYILRLDLLFSFYYIFYIIPDGHVLKDVSLCF